MRRFSLVSVGLAAVMLALSPITAAAATTTTTGISGWEIFQGIPFGGTTYGATFAGWTDSTNTVAPAHWVAPPGSGGNWVLSINYTGTPGSSVAVAGGWWSLRMAGGPRYSGHVASGAVDWVNGTTRCGADNANVDLVLTIAGGGSGKVKGCINDRPSIRPPLVWGTVTLTLPDGGDD